MYRYSERERDLGERADRDHREAIDSAARAYARHAPRPEPVRVHLLRDIVVGVGEIGAAGETHTLDAGVAAQLVAGGAAEFAK